MENTLFYDILLEEAQQMVSRETNLFNEFLAEEEISILPATIVQNGEEVTEKQFNKKYEKWRSEK